MLFFIIKGQSESEVETFKSSLYYIVLYCIVLYCIVLYCIVLYCIIIIVTVIRNCSSFVYNSLVFELKTFVFVCSISMELFEERTRMRCRFKFTETSQVAVDVIKL